MLIANRAIPCTFRFQEFLQPFVFLRRKRYERRHGMKTRVTSGVLAQAFTSLVPLGFSHLNLCVLPELVAEPSLIQRVGSRERYQDPLRDLPLAKDWWLRQLSLSRRIRIRP